ncbi:MAG TPA: MobF family relaxase [Fimbriiglobus sp.]|jgi:conjugative relaxase-like TrwC/TraI family protein
MLRITQQNNSGAAKKYYAVADYYTEGQELIGEWGGIGAKRLGLEGVVDQASFDKLCDNLDPRTGKALTVRTRSERTVGYDFTFSVPKSVSLLYAMSGDRDILDVFRSAVDETMHDMEAEMKTRVRKDKKDVDRETGNMTWAEFIHTTSRPVDGIPDPQLHAHCFVFNNTWDEKEQRFKAGQFRGLKADAPYFQAGFRVRLANKLQDLGFGIERKRDDFELSGIPASAIKRFSRRTEEIERVAEELGITDPKRKAELGAETREKKGKELSWNQLRKEWDGRMTDAERQALAEIHRREQRPLRPDPAETLAVDHALEHAFARKAVAAERELLTEAMKRGLGAVTVEGVERELGRRPLIRGEKDGRAVATTEAVLAEEQKVVDFAKEGRGRFRPLGDTARTLARSWLNAGQQAAVRHVLGSRDSVTLISGRAGTGKTSMMQEAAEGIAAAGKQVVVLAPSVGASFDVLRKEGFPEADTVARFLKDEKMQQKARGQVVWVDEAGMMSTKDMTRLFDAAKGLFARVVLSGDRRQHRAVARGEPLKLLEENAGLPVAELTEVMRQEPAKYRHAVELLSRGETADGFAELAKLGNVREVADADRYKQLSEAYLSAVKERKKDGGPVTALVVSPTHAEIARVTGAIRASLKADDKLGEEHTLDTWVPANLTDAQKKDPTFLEPGDMIQFHQHTPGHKSGSRMVVGDAKQVPADYADRFEVYRPSQLSVAVGDRLRVTKGGKTKDGKHVLATNALLTLKGFTKSGDLVVDHGWVIDKEFGQLTHGYAVTSHASQGKTVDKVFLSVSSESFPAANRRQAYVSISRARQEAVVFTDDAKELLKAIQRADEPMSATELSQSRRRKPPLRHRLKKHLERARRLANFDRLHEPRQLELEQTPQRHREWGHAR